MNHLSTYGINRNREVYRNDIRYDESATPSWTDDQVEPNTDYTYYIVAEYANSTDSRPSNSVSVILPDPVTLPYSLDFEPGTGGWAPNKSVNGWAYGSSGELGISGNNGHFYGIKAVETTVGKKMTDCLISPSTDLSSYKESIVTLTFNCSYLRSPESGKLDVVYRVAADSAWVSLQSLNPDNSGYFVWRSESVILPAEALKATTQLGFLYENHGTGSGGAGIDDIQLTAKSLGIGEISSPIACRIFPSPNNGLFQMELTTKLPGKINIQIFNLNGQVVLDEQISQVTGTESKSFDLRSQAKGVYQIRIQTPDGNWTDRITIQ